MIFREPFRKMFHKVIAHHFNLPFAQHKVEQNNSDVWRFLIKKTNSKSFYFEDSKAEKSQPTCKQIRIAS